MVVRKLIATLPHPNVDVYIDNVNLLEELLKIEDVYVDKKTIVRMLKTEDK